MEGQSSFAKVSFKGMSLHTRHWPLPEDRKPRAILLIAHGLGEHSGSYDNLVDIFISKDISVYSHDHYGHGLSPGVPALVTDMRDIVNPIMSHASQLRAKYPSVPLFLFGHSMGGLAAVMCARVDTGGLFRGFLLNAPALGVNPEFAGACKIAIGRLLARLCPQMARKIIVVN